MALTFPRWLAVAIVACGMIWFALFQHPPEPDRPEPNDDALLARSSNRGSPALVAEGRLAQANDRLRLLELRDSVGRVGDSRQDARFNVVIDAALSNGLREVLERSITRQWVALKIQASQNRPPATIAVIVDTSRAPHGLPRIRRYAAGTPIEIFLPSEATRGRCIAIAHLTSAPQAGAPYSEIIVRNITSPETINALLSPCAFLAAFGEPGPAIAQWVHDDRWSRARLAGWDKPPTPWKAIVGSGGGNARRAAWFSLSNDPSWQIRSFIAPEGIACLAGETGVCQHILLDVRSSAIDSAWRRSVVASAGTGISLFYLANRPTPLGPANGWVVSEMVRTLGPQRFQQFWQSTLPVPYAFKSAAGEDLDTWARDWDRRMYGAASVGPVLSAVGLGTGSFVLAIGVLIAIAVERRRRVA